jgi:hypothetical protein
MEYVGICRASHVCKMVVDLHRARGPRLLNAPRGCVHLQALGPAHISKNNRRFGVLELRQKRRFKAEELKTDKTIGQTGLLSSSPSSSLSSSSFAHSFAFRYSLSVPVYTAFLAASAGTRSQVSYCY